MNRNLPLPYQIFILGLSSLVLGLMAIDFVFELDPAMSQIIHIIDNLVCALFLLDFIVNLATTDNKLKYLCTWGIIDLLSSIPNIDMFRFGRSARMFRIFRLLRYFKSAKVIIETVGRKKQQSSFLAMLLTAIFLTLISSMAILHFETSAASNIKTAEDAVWWSFVTMTTVGYGDYYPVTTEGRIIAAVLMVFGVGLFGTFTAMIASWFVKRDERHTNHELIELHKRLDVIEDEIKKKNAA